MTTDIHYQMAEFQNSFQNECLIKGSESGSRSVVSDSLQPHGLKLTRFLLSMGFSGKNTGAGCHALLQGIFLIQGSNLDLLHRRQILYHLSHKGSPFGQRSSA